MTLGRKVIPMAAVALAALAAWALATFEPGTGLPAAQGPTHDQIDEASRAELGRVLRETRDTE
ncbi:MAG: hypothetical protein JRH01_12435 [Deltaproteobacteria bacterium]|nr:hypothetical protein [Deltaproteobacteria bacterium]MBW2395325.1 hypothetical protein [Deltaproteobacteria bacterium]